MKKPLKEALALAAPGSVKYSKHYRKALIEEFSRV